MSELPMNGRRRPAVFALFVLACALPTYATPPVAPRPPANGTRPPTLDELLGRARDRRETDALLTCPLAVRSVALGPHTGAPSAPFAAGDSVATVLRRGSALVLQRVSREGALAPAVPLLGAHQGSGTPAVVAHESGLYFPVFNQRFSLAAVDLPSGTARADAPAPLLPGAPIELVSGPRGVVALVSLSATEQVLLRGVTGRALPEVRLPAASISYVPREQLLASGAQSDAFLALRRVDPDTTALDLLVLDPAGVTPRSTELARSPRGPESAIAAGPAGFLVAWGHAGYGTLSLARLDPRGALIAPATQLRAPVVRYPRLTALGTGWALSYWDGTGPVLQRFDANAAPLGAPVPVRSGDERGGHTAAQMTVFSGDTLAVTWEVGPPMFDHGTVAEQPRRPGARLALVRCGP